MNYQLWISGMTVGVALLLGLTSCGPETTKTETGPPEAAPSETQEVAALEAARELQNSTLSRLVEYVPQELIIGGMTGPIPEMRALSCNWSEGSQAAWERAGVFLPGGYDVEVAREADLSGVLDAVLASYERLPGWSAVSSGEGDERLLVLTSSEGYSFYVRQYPVTEDARRFSVSSFSPCIGVSEGFDVLDYY